MGYENESLALFAFGADSFIECCTRLTIKVTEKIFSCSISPKKITLPNSRQGYYMFTQKQRLIAFLLFI